MKLLKQYPFWICLAAGLGLFAGTYPFYHDMYIPELFTVLCICLNGFSAGLFGAFLYFIWRRRMDADGRGIFLWLTILQAAGHGILTMMNWGSWLFLGLSVITVVILIISYFKEKEVIS